MDPRNNNNCDETEQKTEALEIEPTGQNFEQKVKIRCDLGIIEEATIYPREPLNNIKCG